ncbi:MAG TPA: hypothetical protein VMD30_01520 [Tepidisphaeraceae bacterium]|nr:hypothetical protein [Tepidisphaeraceae bacterium]
MSSEAEAKLKAKAAVAGIDMETYAARQLELMTASPLSLVEGNGPVTEESERLGSNPSPASLPPPLVPTLNYFPGKVDVEWQVAAVCQSVNQWHETRYALTKAKIETRMRDDGAGGVELLVQRGILQFAKAIIAASQSRRPWCPFCASDQIRDLPLSWRWRLLSIIFLGLFPYSPPAHECETCGRQW